MLSLRHMPLVCLLAPCLALHAQPRNPYDSDLQQLQAGWPAAGKLQKLVLLDHLQRLRDYVNDRSTVQQALENIRQSNMEDPLIKTEAAACLDDLRAFRLPSQPRTPHWYAEPESRKQVLAEVNQETASSQAT